MFRLLESVSKAVVATAALPVDVVADCVTLGGSMTDKPRPYTVERCRDIMAALADASGRDDRGR